MAKVFAMFSTTWTILLALTLPAAGDVEESDAETTVQNSTYDTSAGTRSIYANVILGERDFPEVVEFKESSAPPVLPLGGDETRRTAFQQTARLRSGQSCFLSYYSLDSPAKATEAIRRHVRNVATPSQHVEDVRRFGLDGAEDLYVFDRAFGDECLLFRYGRLTVFLSISNDQQGDAARLRDSLAEAVLRRVKTAVNPRNDVDTEAVQRRSETPQASYEAFLLKRDEFGDVRDFKQRVELRTQLEGSLPRKHHVCLQDAFMRNGELRTIEYILCESPLEACAVLYHRGLTCAEPGRLLVVDDSGPHSTQIRALGGSEAADDVYVFSGSSAGDRASLMLRKDALVVSISVLNDPANRTAETRDSLARAVLRRINDVLREREKAATNNQERRVGISVILENVVYCPGGSPSQQPLICLPGKDFPEGREMTFRDPESGEFVHAVFPKAVAAPENLDGSFVLHGHYQGIQNWDAFQPSDAKRLIKQPPKDYQYFVVSSWEHRD